MTQCETSGTYSTHGGSNISCKNFKLTTLNVDDIIMINRDIKIAYEDVDWIHLVRD
jgi:hypothetical protein